MTVHLGSNIGENDGEQTEDQIYMLNGDDTVTGTRLGDQEIYGGQGADVLTKAGSGSGFLYGGSGDDTLSGGNAADQLFGDDGADVLKGFGGNDGLYGGVGNDQLYGLDGNDLLDGDEGDDTLAGGEGNDTLIGGYGADKFVFNTELDAASNVDRVQDFSRDEVDQILLNDDIFAAVGLSVSKGEFRIGKNAKDDNDHIIYKEHNGKLYYDADGEGGQKKVLFAVLDKGTELSHEDFVLIA